ARCNPRVSLGRWILTLPRVPFRHDPRDADEPTPVTRSYGPRTITACSGPGSAESAPPRAQRHRGRGAAGPAPMTRRIATVIVRTSAIERCVTGVLLLGRTDAITGLIAGDQWS